MWYVYVRGYISVAVPNQSATTLQETYFCVLALRLVQLLQQVLDFEHERSVRGGGDDHSPNMS